MLRVRVTPGSPGIASDSAFRRTRAYPVEAVLDRGKACLDRRFKLRIGENVGPVVLDTLADELTHIDRIDATGDPRRNHFDKLARRTICRRASDRSGEARRQIARRIN